MQEERTRTISSDYIEFDRRGHSRVKVYYNESSGLIKGEGMKLLVKANTQPGQVLEFLREMEKRIEQDPRCLAENTCSHEPVFEIWFYDVPLLEELRERGESERGAKE